MLKLMTSCIGSMTLCIVLYGLASPSLAVQERSVLQPASGDEIQLNSAANNPLQVQALRPTTPLSVQGAQDSERELDLVTKGPLHEAFAELPQDNPAPNPLVTRQPPDPVKELPPEYQPEGENVEWIPGYWAWDEDRADFLWISGIWRDLPPGQRWVPGYWNDEEGGVRWVNGFWMDDEVEEIEYLPAPPSSLDNGPSTPAPSESHFYAPGSWVYRDQDYVWQAGCWMPRVDNWVWVQPCYVWTPRGCVFRAGYWDRLIDCRGVVFAPVCYRRPIYLGVDYFYTPSCVINTNYDLLPHLFVRRNCRSYYFGDWYDNRYLGQGYCAWSRLNINVGFGRCHDPFFAYYNHSSVRYNNVAVVNWARNRYDYCYQNVGFRPPAIFNVNLNIINQKTVVNGQPAPQPVVIADTLERRVKTTARRTDGRDAFRQLAEEERRDYQKRTEPIQEIARERRTAERRAERPDAGRPDVGRPDAGPDPVVKVALPKVDRRQQLAADKAAAELQRQQERDERTARTEERRAATEAATAARREARNSEKLAADNPPVLKRTVRDGETADAERLPKPNEANQPRANRGSRLSDPAGPSVASEEPRVASRQGQPERLTPEQRREATAARQAEQKAEQLAREAARLQERQERSTNRSNPPSGRSVSPPAVTRDAERDNRLAAEQQRQARESELLQRRANDQAARQAADQQRSLEQAMRRQQEEQQRAARQQQELQQREARRMQDQVRQQQQQARDAAARQQRDMERQQRDMQRQQQQQQRQQQQRQQQQQQERQERKKKG